MFRAITGRDILQTEAIMFASLAFPAIDPVAFSIGPLSVRWYGIAYVAGILIAWWMANRMVDADRLWPGNKAPMTRDVLGDFVIWATIGIVLGGRLGYVLFYDLDRTLADPLNMVRIWNGGMSFHGGLAGTALAMILYARKNAVPLWSLIDTVSSVAPMGIAFGRIANFINGELWGRTSDVAWAMVFPSGGPMARHPSQLYEALLEGFLLFAALQIIVWRSNILKRPGLLAGLFACGYALARIFSEPFREPDANIGFLAGGWLTMGMLLSLPLLLAGLWSIWRALRQREPEAAGGETGGNGRQE